MAIHSAAYWRRRSALLMFDRMEGAEVVSSGHAYNQVAASMSKIFTTYEKKFGLTDKEAMRLLNSLSDPTNFKELKKALQRAGTDGAKEVLAQLSSPAYAARIERLQELQTQVDTINRQLYRQDLTREKRWYTNLATDS